MDEKSSQNAIDDQRPKLEYGSVKSGVQWPYGWIALACALACTRGAITVDRYTDWADYIIPTIAVALGLVCAVRGVRSDAKAERIVSLACLVVLGLMCIYMVVDRVR